MHLRVCRLGSAGCAGGKRYVDLETQKEGKKSTPKGREAEVTSTVKHYRKKKGMDGIGRAPS